MSPVTSSRGTQRISWDRGLPPGARRGSSGTGDRSIGRAGPALMMRRPDETLLGAPPYFGSYHSPLPRLDLDYLYRIHSERILRRDGKPDHVERALRVEQAERDAVDIVA